MSDRLPMVSFIIPAKNEEAMLPSTLDSIHAVADNKFKYEIIVIDNDSHDNTVAIAKSKGAQVFVQKSGTIGGLRNIAAKMAKGKCLVFIDADVSITGEWLDPFLDVIGSMNANDKVITGSRCSTDDNAGWIAKSWFRRAQNLHITTHVGTGHMITSKQFFDRLGGFNERLQTGEDYEFCARAKRDGATIFENSKLRVIHFGVPKTLIEFIRREIWHGTGDVYSIKTLISSKVAMLSLCFLAAHLGLIYAIIFSNDNALQIFVCSLIILAIISISSWIKYHYAPTIVILRNIVLYYFYFWARNISIINRILPILSLRAPRAGRSR